MSNIYEGLTKSLSSWEAEGKYKVTKERGTYKGQEVEIWEAHRIKGESSLTRTEMMTMYINVEKKLPLMATDVKGADSDIQHTTTVEFKYPDKGPAGNPVQHFLRVDSETLPESDTVFAHGEPPVQEVGEQHYGQQHNGYIVDDEHRTEPRSSSESGIAAFLQW